MIDTIGVDIYAGDLTYDVACTVTTETGIAGATGPKVIFVIEEDEDISA
jgi:hypothetical protein